LFSAFTDAIAERICLLAGHDGVVRILEAFVGFGRFLCRWSD